jgi:hypothetical protein
MVVTQAIFTKLAFVSHFVNTNTDFHENSANAAADDKRSLCDERTDVVCTHGVLSFRTTHQKCIWSCVA